uniref:Uncharacterized protein n=1 Tax=Meloidogyne enterolobii TaxID=390850 RepID=A0A6V7VBV9_MELEN|nr:unnamed protein product [Meloidogyne enterolobii]
MQRIFLFAALFLCIFLIFDNVKFAFASPLESREYSHHAHPPAYNWDLNKIKSWDESGGPGILRF